MVDHLLPGQAGDRVQQQHAIGRQDFVGPGEEVGVTIVAEVLERADRHDAVDGLVELLPSRQQHSPVARGVHLVERLLHMGGLVLRQCQADDVDVILRDRAPHGGAPAATDIEQRHAGLQT
ncbi:Uncharacterised protein [Mycobacterium tuberculosis]|nr:Uncharacterised protein [Mycobacterium tuberculosis]CKU66099.1 Uncharacterised protein [Mycobacterium tuberculosis]CNX68100.1 Uncharacterised protein [Mycobacterium tuberculosis]CNZ39454.1 Uncharacterised protein [Mycobacterium tuberculosis]